MKEGKDYIEHLIECVRQRPNLYDKTHSDYFVHSVRTASYNAIEAEMKAAHFRFMGNQETNVTNIHKKWRDLRDTFFKIDKKHEQMKESNPEAPDPKYPYYDLLLWLKPHATRIKSLSTKLRQLKEKETTKNKKEVHATSVLIKPEPWQSPTKSPAQKEKVSTGNKSAAKKRRLDDTGESSDPDNQQCADETDPLWTKLALQYLSRIPQSLEKEKMKLSFLTQVLNYINNPKQTEVSTTSLSLTSL